MTANTIPNAVGKITHADCLKGMAKLTEGSIDLVFADPPFNIGYDYDVYNDRKGRKDYLDWSSQWLRLVHRVLKPDGTFWLAIGDEYAAELKILAQEIGFHCRSWVIWYYTFGVNCTRKFSRSHAHVFYFVKDDKKFTFRQDELENRIPSARQLVYADARANPNGRLPDDTWILRPQDLADCFTPLEDSWYFPRVAGTFSERAGFHGCQMPEQLLARIIRTCTHENDIVLDPFCGSATTLAVAKKLGRRQLGYELSKEYVQRGQERLDLIRRGDPIGGTEDPLRSAPKTPVTPDATKKHKIANPQVVLGISKSLFDQTTNGLIEAYNHVRDGYSLDRVIADPDFNTRLEEKCREMGLAGDLVSWNHMLMDLRKKSRLSGMPTTNQTKLSWEDCDKYLFACEIAVRRMRDDTGSATLDDILCDPTLANKFDEIARKFAPGFTSLEYRLGALKLRKAANIARLRGEVQKTSDRRFQSKILLDEWDPSLVTDGPAIYLITGGNGERKLYGGETLDMRERLRMKFEGGRRDVWQQDFKAQEIRYFVPRDRNPMELLGHQSRLIKEHRPLLNDDFAFKGSCVA